MWGPTLSILLTLAGAARGLRYDIDQVGFNLNENKTATNPAEYWGMSTSAPSDDTRGLD